MFEPTNPEYGSVVRESFSGQSFMATLGAELVSVEPGRVQIAWRRRDDLLQQHGFLHAGVATSLVDSACGYAALTLAAPKTEVLTVEFKVNFLRPASGEDYLAVGEVLKPGKTVSVCQGDVYQDGGRRLIARMQATMAFQPV